MNLDDLTLGQIKQLQGLIGETKTQGLPFPIGGYVLVRSRNEGINAGFLKEADDTGCILEQARRVWYHKPKDVNTSWYEGVANSGLSDDSKISAAVSVKVIVEDYSLTLCTDEAMKSISGKASYGQN
jgi:hypothetical protein